MLLDPGLRKKDLNGKKAPLPQQITNNKLIEIVIGALPDKPRHYRPSPYLTQLSNNQVDNSVEANKKSTSFYARTRHFSYDFILQAVRTGSRTCGSLPGLKVMLLSFGQYYFISAVIAVLRHFQIRGCQSSSYPRLRT